MANIVSIAPNPSDSIIQVQSVVPTSSSGSDGGNVGSSNSAGGGGGGGSTQITTYSVTSSRIEAKSAGIIGQINHGEFENIATQIRIDTESYYGFVKSSDLLYNNGSWTGAWILNIPTGQAQDALFNFRQLIDSNGKVLTVQLKTEDVTERVRGNASAVPYSTMSIKLHETSTIISHSPLAQFFPAFGTISDIANGAIYWTIIGLPTYGLILLLVIASRRIFIPILVKVAQVSKAETKEQPK